MLNLKKIFNKKKFLCGLVLSSARYFAHESTISMRNFFAFIFLFFSFFPLFAATASSSTSSSASDWTISSMEFTFSQTRRRGQSSAEAAKVLPQLILERISSGSVRQIPEKEVLDRKLKELQTERLSLFLQLSKENQTRDALVLSSMSERKLKKSLKEEDGKIKEIEDKIKENLEKVDKEIAEAEKKIRLEENIKSGQLPPNPDEAKENSSQNGSAKSENPEDEGKKGFFVRAGDFFRPFAFPFFHRDEENKIVEESVVVYKSDPSALFKPSDQAKEDGFSSWTFEKEVTSSKINGLLSGKITSYGDYCSVTVELRTYPGAKIAGTVTEVGMLGELIPLATRIAASLSPKISNTLPVKIEFDVFPEDAREKLVVTVDGVVQQMLSKTRAGRDAENSILVNAGAHRVVIESEGYEALSVLYNFQDESTFTVKAELVPDAKNQIHIRLKKFKDGIFYANGLESSEVSPENPYGTLTVNGKPALAVFKAAPAETEKDDGNEEEEILESNSENQTSQTEISQDDKNKETSSKDKKASKIKKKKVKEDKSGKLEPKEESNIAFIQIPQNSAFDGAYLVANAKPYDRAANIDHRRRMMYLAYSGLICSLPFTFYNLGNFTAENNAYNSSDSNGSRRASYDDVQKWQQRSYISLGVTAVFGAWTVFELVRYLYAADKVLPVKAKVDKKSAKILQQIEENEAKMNPVIETIVVSGESLDDSGQETDESDIIIEN